MNSIKCYPGTGSMHLIKCYPGTGSTHSIKCYPGFVCLRMFLGEITMDLHIELYSLNVGGFSPNQLNTSVDEKASKGTSAWLFELGYRTFLSFVIKQLTLVEY